MKSSMFQQRPYRVYGDCAYTEPQGYQSQHPELLVTYREISDSADMKIQSLANEQDGGYIYVCHSYIGSQITQGIRLINENMVQKVRNQVEKSIKILDSSKKKILTKIDCLRFRDREEYIIRISIWSAPDVKQFFYETQKQDGKTIYQIYSVGNMNNQPIVEKVEGENIYHRIHFLLVKQLQIQSLLQKSQVKIYQRCIIRCLILMIKVAKCRRERKTKISKHSTSRHEITVNQAKSQFQ